MKHLLFVPMAFWCLNALGAQTLVRQLPVREVGNVLGVLGESRGTVFVAGISGDGTGGGYYLVSKRNGLKSVATICPEPTALLWVGCSKTRGKRAGEKRGYGLFRFDGWIGLDA